MSPSPCSCVLLIDDHALFRAGLGVVLRRAWPAVTVQEAASITEALSRIGERCPDLIVLDVHLPDANGLAMLGALRVRCGRTVPVAVVSSGEEADHWVAAREAGASAYLCKSAEAGQIISTLEACLAGGRCFPVQSYGVPSAPQVLQACASVPPARSAMPTAQQRDILQLLGKGVPNKAIARQIGLSENDVRAEVSWLTDTLEACSRQQAYEAALARGWLSP